VNHLHIHTRPHLRSSARHRRRLAPVAVLVVLGLLAACGGGDAERSTDTSATAGEATASGSDERGWTFEDDAGITHHLDEVPDTIVAQASAAGALWEYDVVAKGVFGKLTQSDGSPDPGIGRADPDDFTSIGTSETEINVEALIAMDPDIVVTGMWEEGDYWGIPEGDVERIEKVAPIVGIRVDNRAMDVPLARFAELAESLGADEAEVASLRKELDTASDDLEASVEGNPGVTFVAASGSPSEMYVAYPPAFADLRYLQGIGLDIVVPKTHETSGGFWETISWEEVGTYPADVVMADARGGTMKEIADFLPPPAKNLPAIEAGQIMAWPASLAFGYGNVADYLNDVRAMLEKADPDIA
jgi:iron complex transport system substrate-binding protein